MTDSEFGSGEDGEPLSWAVCSYRVLGIPFSLALVTSEN